MALKPRDMPITREDVAGWLKSKPGNTKVEDHIRKKVDDLKLDDPHVDTSAMDHWPHDQTHVADVIIADLDSYAPGS